MEGNYINSINSTSESNKYPIYMMSMQKNNLQDTSSKIKESYYINNEDKFLNKSDHLIISLPIININSLSIYQSVIKFGGIPGMSRSTVPRTIKTMSMFGKFDERVEDFIRSFK